MIYKQWNTDNAAILIWKIDEQEQELIQLLPDFSIYESELNQLKSNKRRLEFLAARVALNSITDANIEVIYTADGKPLCKNGNFHISISHTANWIAVIIHNNYLVGIDIEVPTDKFRNLYKRFLNTNEQNTLFNEDDLLKVQLAWSAKETLYKIIGFEAINFDKQLEVLPFTAEKCGMFCATHLVSNKSYLMHYIANDQFNLVYCIDKPY